MFKPKKGDQLTVQLPGEVLRVTVARVPNRDSAVVVMDAMPMTRAHPYKMGDEVLVHRTATPLGEAWMTDETPRVVVEPARARR